MDLPVHIRLYVYLSAYVFHYTGNALKMQERVSTKKSGTDLCTLESLSHVLCSKCTVLSEQ